MKGPIACLKKKHLLQRITMILEISTLKFRVVCTAYPPFEEVDILDTSLNS